MQQALKRIDELQNDIIEKSKNITGADKYVSEKMRLFQENEKRRKELMSLQVQEQILTETFLSTHQ